MDGNDPLEVLRDADVTELALLIDLREPVGCFQAALLKQVLIGLNHPGRFPVDVDESGRIQLARDLEGVQLRDPPRVGRVRQGLGQRLHLAVDRAGDGGAGVIQHYVQLPVEGMVDGGLQHPRQGARPRHTDVRRRARRHPCGHRRRGRQRLTRGSEAGGQQGRIGLIDALGLPLQQGDQQAGQLVAVVARQG